ncbi:SOS response-associated peptidase [Sphingomonas sp. SM33]|uniref:Abasic site processing protein n=2 Tax=Sphingomonas telluris TaxID=2907998 RepID=A0ABS9VQA7_9SPHN|nr:SOS response-associated peptidase [Sphingomonas telluris]
MTATVDEMRRVFGAFEGDRDNLPPFDEIYPNYKAPVLRRNGSRLKLEMMTWGFPGPQASGGRPVTNVRKLSSPFWRSALTDPARRCLVPVTTFCEWTAEPDPLTKRKSKVWFGHPDQPVFAFAGIWRPGEGGPFMSFLTCQANKTVGAIHPKAMPVMLDPRSFNRWLEIDRDNICELAVPYADEGVMVVG